MKVVLRVAEGWILLLEIRISEYKTVIKCIKILNLRESKMITKKIRVNYRGKWYMKLWKCGELECQRYIVCVCLCASVCLCVGLPELRNIRLVSHSLYLLQQEKKWSYHEEKELEVTSVTPLHHSCKDYEFTTSVSNIMMFFSVRAPENRACSQFLVVKVNFLFHLAFFSLEKNKKWWCSRV